uniref:ribonuclease H n=1 Tax=Paramormyrops kingsleyae TaxID=1676925 RepID=A0A3B3SGE7_9TELE
MSNLISRKSSQSGSDLLQQQVDHLTNLVSQLMESRTATTALPDSPPRASATVPVALPEKYDGNLDHCQEHPDRFWEDTARIQFVISLLTGRACEWATALWLDDSPLLDSAWEFQQAFKEIFDHPAVGRSLGERLFDLWQGTCTVAEFALDFCAVAAGLRWPEEVLRILYHRTINQEVQHELMVCGAKISFEDFIRLSVTIDNSIRRHLQPAAPVQSTSVEEPTEPMQLGRAPLKKAGHVLCTCPIRPTRLAPHAKVGISAFLEVSLVPITVPVLINSLQGGHHAKALVDSGAVGNFSLALESSIPLQVLSNPVTVLGVNGAPLHRGEVSHRTGPIALQVGVLHRETLDFLVLPEAKDPIILGLPWLRRHNPVIDWGTGELSTWSTHCLCQCLTNPCQASSIESPEPEDLSHIPKEYLDYQDVFNKALSFMLPPHCECDCAIDLVEGHSLPKGHLYPLSIAEEAMETYIQEGLRQGIIRSSTSPITAGFFFVKKKDGGLRPCIDFRALNAITIKQREATYFTKLDLRSAYNLIRICQGDKWKTSFVTSTGQFKYCVMPYGLANSSSIFQSFMYTVFQGMINHFVVVPPASVYEPPDGMGYPPGLG